MGRLKVLEPGFYTTVQDLGRFGSRKYGVPISGAMDSKSLEEANLLVGNKPEAPVLECTFDGGNYAFESPATIAITGADSDVQINGRLSNRFKKLQVSKGDLLKIGHPKRGVRTYIAIQGDWNVPKVMDSYSTYVPGAFGGLKGRPLQSNDILEWKPLESNKSVSIPEVQIPYFSSKLLLDVIPGPEWNLLNEEQKQQILDAEFSVESTSNRMAIRFSGAQINANIADMKSSAVAPGIIQLPPSGVPILLMKDAQTIGGYPRILHVANYQLWRVGQLGPGNTVRFKLRS